MSTDHAGLLSRVSRSRLERRVRDLEGIRHGWENPEAVESGALWLTRALQAAGLQVESRPVPLRDRMYRNLVATLPGSDPNKPGILLGAHYDGPSGSPGADDNASGVAVLLEVAEVLARTSPLRTIQFVAFTLEEPQGAFGPFLVGSGHFAKEAKAAGIEYGAVLILECVGYADSRPGRQNVPPLVRIPVPSRAEFLAVVADRRSKRLMEAFRRYASGSVPELDLVCYKAPPLANYLIPEVRFSDHASFWDQGYPALMLTDTAMLRNPHYHAATDTSTSLDFCFMTRVAKAVLAAVAALSNQQKLFSD
jgi:Zn-dependent M28 family amino/carboxypeptidase